MLFVTCALLKEEAALAQEACGIFPPTLFLPEETHGQPSSLPRALEALLSGGEFSGPLLLAGGWCGHGLAGYRPPFQLVAPRASDCPELLLFPEKKEPGVYYLSESWLNSENSLPRQFQAACEKHGREKALRIYDRLFAGYHALCLLENPARAPLAAREAALSLARLLRLELKTAPAGAVLLQKMLRGEWEGHFHVFPANEPVPAFY
ncbi:MAG: DUF1638 domain-containing protein [Clostridiales bacterium]|nr:DUF1638 domain-containing protein [Clostridiales bacterium]